MDENDADQDCYACRQEALGEAAPLDERLCVTASWRVVHSFNSSLEGWLVLLPRRHVLTVAELSDEEAGELGPLLQRASRALTDELGCTKTYVMQFSEAEGFHHLHFHVVPRPPDLPAEHRGPNVFHFLRQPEAEWVSPERRAELARRIGDRLAAL
jgi:diadenosine tetraphosphate (Ap4A) HIT family hydrolase